MNTGRPLLPANFKETYIGSNLRGFQGKVDPGMMLTNNFTDYICHRRYIAGGANLAKGEYRFFHLGVGEQDVFINNNTLNYETQPCDTNLEGKGGQLIKGLNFWIASIEFAVILTNHAATTPFAGDNSTTLNPLPDAAAEQAADNLLIMLRENTTFSLFEDRSRKYEEGSLDCFPAAGGQFGYTGTGDGIAQNGGLSNRPLATVRNLEELQNFYGLWSVWRAIAIPAGLTFSVQAKLVGRGQVVSG